MANPTPASDASSTVVGRWRHSDSSTGSTYDITISSDHSYHIELWIGDWQSRQIVSRFTLSGTWQELDCATLWPLMNQHPYIRMVVRNLGQIPKQIIEFIQPAGELISTHNNSRRMMQLRNMVLYLYPASDCFLCKTDGLDLVLLTDLRELGIPLSRRTKQKALHLRLRGADEVDPVLPPSLLAIQSSIIQESALTDSKCRFLKECEAIAVDQQEKAKPMELLGKAIREATLKMEARKKEQLLREQDEHSGAPK